MSGDGTVCPRAWVVNAIMNNGATDNLTNTQQNYCLTWELKLQIMLTCKNLTKAYLL